MNASVLKKFVLAAGAVAILGAAGGAVAAPSFNFDPNGGNSGTGGSTPVYPAFTADQFNGLSSELITFSNNGQNASATGYFYLTGASLGGQAVDSIGRYDSGRAANFYGLYLTFTLTNHVIATGPAGTTYALDSLSFKFYVDPKNDTTFVKPNATTATGGTVTGGTVGAAGSNSVDDVMIASGDLIAGTGLATIGSQAQVRLDSNETFLNVNPNYFTFPSPFYAIALDSFNNTGGAYTTNTANTVGAINGAGGTLTFTNVPEPSTVALFGIALVGMGVAARRRKG